MGATILNDDGDGQELREWGDGAGQPQPVDPQCVAAYRMPCVSRLRGRRMVRPHGGPVVGAETHELADAGFTT